VKIHAVVLTVTLLSHHLGFRNIHDATLSPLCEKMSHPQKTEVHNLSQCRQKRTNPRATGSAHKNVKFDHIFSEICDVPYKN